MEVIDRKKEEQLNALYKWIVDEDKIKEFKNWIRKRYTYAGKDSEGRDIYTYSYLWCECDALLSDYLYFLFGYSGFASTVYRHMSYEIKEYLLSLMKKAGIDGWSFELSNPDDSYWADYYIYLY